MKKLITLLLILALLIPAASLADLPDIFGLTEDELLELNHQIQFRLFSEKLVNGVEVPPGKYEIGTDIPAGTYRLVIVYPKSGGWLHVYNDADSKVYTKDYFLGEYWGVAEIGKATFEEGNIIEIGNNALKFFPYSGLFN